MVLSVLLAAILDFLRDSWPGLRRWNSSNQKCYFEHESQVCVSAVHPDMVYNHDNWDFICYFGGHFFLQFWKGKTKNRAWHGADLESAYLNCVKTTAWQILLRNALQTLRMPLFEKWALTNTSYNRKYRSINPNHIRFGKPSRLHYTALVTLYGCMVPFFAGYIIRWRCHRIM